MDRCHALALRGERDFPYAGHQLVHEVLGKPHANGGHNQGSFRGISHSVIAPFVAAIVVGYQGRIVAERAPQQKKGNVGGWFAQGGFIEPQNGASRPETLDEIEGIAGHIQHGDGHAILSQRAGLVGADCGHRAQCLYRRQLADQGSPAHHSLRAEGQSYGHHGGQSFGDGRNGQAHRDQEHLGQTSPAPDPDSKDQSADGQSADRQPLAQLAHAAL